MSTHARATTITARLRRQLQREGAVFAAAWQYFTRIPSVAIPWEKPAIPPISLHTSARYAPLIGAIIGTAAALVFLFIFALLDSKPLAVLCSLIMSILLTSAIHESGAAHFFEAFRNSNRSKEEIFRILETPGIAAVGSLALLFDILLKYHALIHIPNYTVPFALIAAHAFARFAAFSFVYTDPSADDEANEDGKPSMQPVAFMVMAAFGMLPLLLMGNLLLLLLVPLLWLARALMGMWFINRIGGWTTDALSAVLLVVELLTYILIHAANLYAFAI